VQKLVSARPRKSVDKQLTSHQFDHVRVGLLEDESDVLSITLFQLLLQVTAAVLILAKSVDLADEVQQVDAGVTGVVWIHVSLKRGE